MYRNGAHSPSWSRSRTRHGHPPSPKSCSGAPPFSTKPARMGAAFQMIISWTAPAASALCNDHHNGQLAQRQAVLPVCCSASFSHVRDSSDAGGASSPPIGRVASTTTNEPTPAHTCMAAGASRHSLEDGRRQGSSHATNGWSGCPMPTQPTSRGTTTNASRNVCASRLGPMASMTVMDHPAKARRSCRGSPSAAAAGPGCPFDTISGVGA